MAKNPDQRRPVSGFPGYTVNAMGVVFGKKGMPLKGSRLPAGYLTVGFWLNRKLHTRTIHSVVAGAWLDQKPSDKHEVAHNNGINTDNRADNLRWATHADNGKDMVIHGHSTQGIRHPNAKLDDDTILKIRSAGASGMLFKDLGEMFGISRQHARKIMTGERWPHLPGIINERRKTGPRPHVS